MLNVIATLVPSFYVDRQPIDDGRTFIRPPELRGMSGDKVLVLVNNTRRHRSALVSTVRDGANGPDLASIPSIALKSVEVLRDGASAVYGSDAIAGVINFNLRDEPDGGELRVQSGQYSEGDETGYVIALNQGIAIGNRGFINISAELSENDATSRGTFFDQTIGNSGLTPQEAARVSGLFDHDNDPATPDQMRYGPDAWTEVYQPGTGELVTIFYGSDGVPDDTDPVYATYLPVAEITNTPYVTVWGAPEREAIRSFVNAGLELAGGSELYGWANYSDSDTNGNFLHRRPGSRGWGLLRSATGEIFDPRAIFPAGFTPRFAGNVVDKSFTGGIRGELANGLVYDFGGRWGENQLNYTLSNTINPSLGLASPTSFRPGGLVSDESAIATDFALPVDVGLFSDLNVAFGVEYREEGYELLQGDPMSWEIGPYAFPDPFNFEIDVDEAAAGQNGGSVGCFIPGPQYDPTSLCDPRDPIHNSAVIGSDGFVGYPPSGISNYSRHSWAAYADLEADISDNVLATVAGRYEDFSDFGSNFSWRVAGLWRINDAFRLRASAGTGFRAPTPGQLSTINIRNQVTSASPLEVGLYPASHPASILKGATPLDAETSTQFTFGFTTIPSDDLTITLDYYFIALEDQIWLSSRFDISDTDRAFLQSQGVPGADSIGAVAYFTNDVDTETSGIDLVATYDYQWRGGTTSISIAGNYNRFEVTRRTNRQSDPANPTPVYFVNDRDVFQAENGDPQYRLILNLRHAWNNSASAFLRANWYGDYEVTSNNLSQTQTMSGGAFWDAEATWGIGESLSLALGASNLFNEFPDALPDFVGCCGQVYDPRSKLDWQGRFVYLRGIIRWN